MTAQTTGQDVLDRVSEAEATCLRSSIGDEAYEEFLGGEVLTSYEKVGDLDSLFSCITGDNFVLLGVGFTAARAEVTPEIHTCLFDLGREHPAEGAWLQQKGRSPRSDAP